MKHDNKFLAKILFNVMKFKETYYMIWEKMLCDNVILGLPLGVPPVLAKAIFVVILLLWKAQTGKTAMLFLC